jgi:oxalate decarboxylase/phosphoglucose isomerase-like protein (cupin superfamily)
MMAKIVDERKLSLSKKVGAVDESEIPPVTARRQGSSGYGYLRLLFDPGTVGSANAVLATITIPPGQPEPMLPHAHFEYDESEYVVSGEGYYLIGPSRDQLQRYDVKPGRAVFIPAGYPHTIVNTGEVDMKLVFSFFPGWVKGRPLSEIMTELTDVVSVEGHKDAKRSA